MAFVYSQMGYWIETESNTFWTFDASLVHGTMLPAEKTAAQMRTRTRLRDGQPAGGGSDVPVSNGQHKPTRERDNRRAAEHVRIQREREQRDAYWNIAE
ncbi:hypothetical protein HHX47_DHR8000262 [Lentinula edodes]|nr:hypothetical protein HHX47_DHR8000262 [Lentinula edodes]